MSYVKRKFSFKLGGWTHHISFWVSSTGKVKDAFINVTEPIEVKELQGNQLIFAAPFKCGIYPSTVTTDPKNIKRIAHLIVPQDVMRTLQF